MGRGRRDAGGRAGAGRAAAREFRRRPPEVARLAGRDLAQPRLRALLRGPALRWAGNEVPVAEAGEVLRIDRLVALEDEAPGWWVLDYKLQHAPAGPSAYREQLRRYREAVQALQPGDAVRAAFITGAGEVVEL